MRINNVYFPTWRKDLNWTKGFSTLSRVPKYINNITLSFFRPDGEFTNLNQPMDTLFYDGDIDLSVLKREIQSAKANGGKDRIILASAGGEIGGDFLKVNYKDLVDAVYELGLDGIDLDYEPNGLMTKNQEEIDKYIEIITTFRKEFDKKTDETGKKFLITCAPTGIGLLGREDEFSSLGIKELEKFNASSFQNIEDNFCSVLNNLKTIIPEEQWSEEMNIGSTLDDPILKQPKFKVGTLGSCYNFDSAGKMAWVFLHKNTDSDLSKYNYVGQMVDTVFYQAYNMGSGNTLGKIMCYESYRALSDYFNNDISGSGFSIGHGSHVGMEAWPHYSYTKKRLHYIYSYINQFGREGDGSSFWSYSSPYTDESDNVPDYGMEFESTKEIFKFVSETLGE